MNWSLFWFIAGYVAGERGADAGSVITAYLADVARGGRGTGGFNPALPHLGQSCTNGRRDVVGGSVCRGFTSAAANPGAAQPRDFGGTGPLIGAFAAQRVDCGGLHRNALVAFVNSALPQVSSRTAAASNDWRATAANTNVAEDLTSLRGAAVGRNVVLIALESTGARSLRCYEREEDPAPNLTRLAATSLLFENAYSVYPESIKGLFSMLCSRYPAFDTRAEDYARIRTPSIAEVLAGEGCRTALFHSGRFMYLGMNAVIQQRGFKTLEDAGTISGNFNSSFGVDEPAISPIVGDGLVVLVRDELKDPVIIAVDIQTGAVRWQRKRQASMSFSTPIVWDTAAGKQIVMAGHAQMIGYDLGSGEEKWSAGGVPSACCIRRFPHWECCC